MEEGGGPQACVRSLSSRRLACALLPQRPSTAKDQGCMVVPVPAHSEHTLGGHGHAAGVAGGGHLFRSGVLLAIGSRSVSTLSFAMANGARGSRAGVASLSSSSSSSSSLVWGWCGRGWGDVSFGSLWGLKAGGGRVCPFRFSLVCPCTAGCRGGVMTPRERKGGEWQRRAASSSLSFLGQLLGLTHDFVV